MELNLSPELASEQVQLLLEVLGWYADTANWQPWRNPILSAMYPLIPAVAVMDGGRMAREVLEGMNG